MELSNIAALELKTPERPIRTYQRSSKPSLQKQTQLENSDESKIDSLKSNISTQTQDKDQDISDWLSVRRVPPEMLVINIEEVISSTHFDPELLNAVKARSINTAIKRKPKSPETVLANSKEFYGIPPKTTSSATVLPEPKVSETILVKLKGSQVLAKPPVSESGLAKLQVPAEKPKVCDTALVKPTVSVAKPTVSAEVLAKSKMLVGVLHKPTVFKVVPVKSRVSAAVPAVSLAKTMPKIELAKLELSKEVVEKTKVSGEVPAISNLSKEILAKLQVPEGVPEKPKLLSKIIVKPTVSEEVLAKLKLSKEALAKSKYSKEVLAKSKVREDVLGNPKVFRRILAKPTTSGEVPLSTERVLVKPKGSDGGLAKPKVSGGVLVKSKMPESVLGKPKVLRAILAEPTASDEVPVSTEEVLIKPTGSDGGLAKLKVSKHASVKPKVLKVAVVKPKTPKEAAEKPKIPKVVLVKPQTTEGTLVKPNKSDQSVVVMTVGSKSADLKTRIKTTLPEETAVSKIEAIEPNPINPNLPEYVSEYDPALNANTPPDFSLLPLHPLPIKNEPTLSADIIKLLTEHLTPLLPRCWSLRVEDDAIYAVLFAPGANCVVQRAVGASYDGSGIKFIIHGNVLPNHHSVYKQRLMRPHVELTSETVETFASGVMGAVHSIREYNICVGLDEDEFMEEWQEHTDDCRLDENIFDEDGYERTLRPFTCSFLVKRRDTRRCPHCNSYYSYLMTNDKRKSKLGLEVEIVEPIPKKSRNV